MTCKLLSAALLAGALAVTAAGCGSSQKHSGAHIGHSMTEESGTSGMNMQGMRPLVTGADGTHPSAAGLALRPTPTEWAAGRQATWRFRIVDRGGMALTRFERDQTKLLHLIVVRSDFTDYQHLHPALKRSGVWSIPMTLHQPGAYRAIADFSTAGKRYALGFELTVPGSASPIPLPAPSRSSSVDGYTVTVSHGALHAGADVRLTFTVSKDGKSVSDLQPYLGAYGHLVALRKPDLAYSHVHPDGEDLKQGSITFVANLRTTATYRLFLQFAADGMVQTAPFTIEVGR